MKTLTDFFGLYKLYRRPLHNGHRHTRRYALERAWQISFKGYPF